LEVGARIGVLGERERERERERRVAPVEKEGGGKRAWRRGRRRGGATASLVGGYHRRWRQCPELGFRVVGGGVMAGAVSKL
jgi:hypothetical protein